MSLIWMSIVAVLILGQKPLPPRTSIDLPLALAIVAQGILVVLAPSAFPGSRNRCERQDPLSP
jgi:hypothetical protein